MSSAPFVLCMERYQRVVPWVSHPVTFSCQLLRGHEGEHSWWPLKESDELAMQPPEPEPLVVVDIINGVLLDIAAGIHDPYLENILAVAHERKRVLRGVRSFDQPTRPQPRRTP